MKTTLSKRMLSLLMAILMVVTSVPLMAFSAIAAEINSELAAAKYPGLVGAMETYEGMMDGTIYTNMGTAYDAYVAAQLALDQALYGGNEANVSTATQNLNDAIDIMDPYNGINFNTAVYHYSYVATDGYSNAVYSSGTSISSLGSEAGIDIKYMLPENIVLAYDGSNPVAVPAVIGTLNPGKNLCYSPSCRYVASTNGTMYFDTVWNGYMDGDGNKVKWNGTTRNYYWPKDNIGDVTSTLASTTGGSPIHTPDNTNTVRYWWNRLVYHGTGNTTDYFDSFSNLGVTSIIDYQNYRFKASTATINISCTNNIYVINFKPIKQLIEGYASTLSSTFSGTTTVADYSEGGLNDIMHALQTLTSDSVNPKSYDYSTGVAGKVSDCGEAIGNAVDTCTGKTVGNKDNANFNRLRNDIDLYRSTYDGGQSNWSDGTWPDFKRSYEAAVTFMAGITNYNNSTTAGTKADDLERDKEALTLAETFEPVDASVLTVVINNAEFALANPTLFENINVTQLTNLVDEAKADVWNDSLFGNDSALIPNKDNNQQTVTNHTNYIKNYMATLRPNVNCIVPNTHNNSMQSLVDMVDAMNPSDYINFSTINEEYDACTSFMNTPTVLDATVPNIIQIALEEYRELAVNLHEAIEALNLSFLAIPDGQTAQVANSTNMPQLEHTHSGGKNQYIDFSYTPSAVVFVKGHDTTPKQYNYGTAVVKFSVAVDGDARVNNMIDSITIAPTDGATSSGEFNKGDNDKPSALSDAQKTTYAGCIENGDFALRSFKILERYNNDSPYTALNSAGTNITDYNSPEITTIISTTDGTGDKPAKGGIFVNGTKNNTGSVSIGADMSFTFAADPAPAELTEDTVPTIHTKSYTGHNFGALTVWNMQSGAITYQGYSFFRSSDTISTTVNFIDISNLIDLVNICDEKAKDVHKYTTNSFSQFNTALEAAKDALEYNTMTLESLMSTLETRYQNLYRKMKALKVNTYDVTFNYMNGNGVATSESIQVKYDDTLSMYASQVTDIQNAVPSYTSSDGRYTYTLSEATPWTPALDMDTPIRANVSYTANYDSTENSADFTEYERQRNYLMGAIVNNAYYAGNLEELNTILTNGSLKYFNYTDAQKATTYSDENEDIADEAMTLKNLRETYLVAYTLTIDAAEALDARVQAAIEDVDRFDAGILDKYKDSSILTATVTVLGEPVIAFTYPTQKALDDEITATLELLNTAENAKNYTVYIDGVPCTIGDDESCAGKIPYGTAVIVDSNGKITLNVADMKTNYDGESVAWRYSYAAPSNQNVPTASKYILSAPSLGFIVKGDTYLTTAKAEATSAYTVKVVSAANGRVIDKVTTTGTYVMPYAPACTGYAFSGYSNGAVGGQEIEVNADITIKANYVVDKARVNTYVIDFYESLESYIVNLGTPDDQFTKKYNQLVEIPATDDVYCWARAEYPDETLDFTVIAYASVANPTYSFYACENMYSADDSAGLVALTRAEYEAAVSGYIESEYMTVLDMYGNSTRVFDTQGVQILPLTGDAEAWDFNFTYKDVAAEVKSLPDLVEVYNSEGQISKYSMVGQFIIPDGYTMIECGFLYTNNTSNTDLKVEQVDNSEIFRFKSSRYTVGNQFVINLVNDGLPATFNYTPYMIVKNGSKTTAVYGTTHMDVTING